MVAQSRLKELLHYDPETGVVTWRATRGGVRAGTVAGSTNHNGYLQIGVDGRDYLVHRLVWLYVHGDWPKHQIDHINGVRADNRIANLREATNAENNQNLAIRPHNTSGFMGACWDSERRKWLAQIRADGKRKYLGRFDTPEVAHAAYLSAKSELHTFQPTMRAG